MGDMGNCPGKAAEQTARTAPGLQAQARQVYARGHLLPIPNHRDPQNDPGQGPEDQRQPGHNGPDVTACPGPLGIGAAVHFSTGRSSKPSPKRSPSNARHPAPPPTARAHGPATLWPPSLPNPSTPRPRPLDRAHPVRHSGWAHRAPTLPPFVFVDGPHQPLPGRTPVLFYLRGAGGHDRGPMGWPCPPALNGAQWRPCPLSSPGWPPRPRPAPARSRSHPCHRCAPRRRRWSWQRRSPGVWPLRPRPANRTSA